MLEVYRPIFNNTSLQLSKRKDENLSQVVGINCNSCFVVSVLCSLPRPVELNARQNTSVLYIIAKLACFCYGSSLICKTGYQREDETQPIDANIVTIYLLSNLCCVISLSTYHIRLALRPRLACKANVHTA
jgi:predicted membrane channel-forming protein YqfA (hemolysin III family)